MPAGSGPQAVGALSVVLPANTTENVLVVLPAGNWNSALGSLLAFSVLVSGAATGTLTFRVRQGNGTAGTIIGASVPIATAAATIVTPGMDFIDTSAFGIAQQQGQYTLTYQQSANSLGTLSIVTFTQETIAPIQ